MRIPAVVAVLFLLAGCTVTAEPVPNTDIPTETLAVPPEPPTVGLAELCSDLDVVDATLVVFSEDIGKAAVAEAQGVAGVVVEQGTALLPDAPEDIRTELSTVIAATQEAVGHLATPDLDAAGEVMSREDVTAAREAIGAYPPCG
jgi:hypothetical protein